MDITSDQRKKYIKEMYRMYVMESLFNTCLFLKILFMTNALLWNPCCKLMNIFQPDSVSASAAERNITWFNDDHITIQTQLTLSN